MINMKYDVIVVGGGHAGCEAANASAKQGLKVALITSNINNIKAKNLYLKFFKPFKEELKITL